MLEPNSKKPQTLNPKPKGTTTEEPQKPEAPNPDRAPERRRRAQAGREEPGRHEAGNSAGIFFKKRNKLFQDLKDFDLGFLDFRVEVCRASGCQ